MSFRKLFLDGIHPKFRRNNYISDSITAKKSTFNYSGSVTHDSTSNGIRTRDIDNTIVYTTVDERDKEGIQDELRNLKIKAYFAGFGSITGIVAGFIAICDTFVLSGLGTVFLSSSIAHRSFVRASQITEELIKWDDQIDKICEIRKSNLDYNTMLAKGYFDKNCYFTKEEEQNKFHATMEYMYDEFLRKSSGDSKECAEWIDDFIMKWNPLIKISVLHAFENNEIIIDPENTMKGFWPKTKIDVLIQFSEDIKRKHLFFKAEEQKKLIAIKNDKEVGKTTINEIARMSNNMIDRNLENTLSFYMDIKNNKLSILEKKKSQMDYHEYESKRKEIIDDYENNVNVKRIKSSAEQNKESANTVRISANHLLSANQKRLKENVLAESRAETLRQFALPVEEIFESYKNSRS